MTIADLVNGFHKTKDKYILDKDHNVIKANLMEWEAFYEDENRIVKQEKIGELFVSTVFLGLDHGIEAMWRDPEKCQGILYKPLIFETMVFNHDSTEIYCDRYSTWKEAEEGHQKAIEWVKDGCNENTEICE